MSTISNPTRISLWSGPRNVSTALMYSFAQRTDTRVYDEPLYGYYLNTVRAPHPGLDEIIAVMACDGQKVINETILGPQDKPVVFFKNMPHHLLDLDLGFLKQLVNVLLIRDPVEMLPSYNVQIESPVLRDTGLDAQLALFNQLQAWGQTPPVIDSKQFLLNPRGVLEKLCQQIGIPFEANMLQWEAGPRPEDGIWAKYWYHSVHKSTGFQTYKAKTAPFPERLKPLLTECQPYYDALYQHAIKADMGD